MFRKSDMFDQAMKDIEKEDNKALKDEKIHLKDVIDQGIKAQSMLSEEGWKTMKEIFTSCYRRTIIEIRNPSTRDEAVATQRALMMIWNIISNMIGAGSAAQRNLAEMAELEEDRRGGLPGRFDPFL